MKIIVYECNRVCLSMNVQGFVICVSNFPDSFSAMYLEGQVITVVSLW